MYLYNWVAGKLILRIGLPYSKFMSFDRGSLRESFNIFLMETTKQIVLNIYLNSKIIRFSQRNCTQMNCKKTNIGRGGGRPHTRIELQQILLPGTNIKIVLYELSVYFKEKTTSYDEDSGDGEPVHVVDEVDPEEDGEADQPSPLANPTPALHHLALLFHALSTNSLSRAQESLPGTGSSILFHFTCRNDNTTKTGR